MYIKKDSILLNDKYDLRPIVGNMVQSSQWPESDFQNYEVYIILKI